MDKIKAFFKKLWGVMNDPRFEKPLLIAIPCLALLLCAMILGPRLLERSLDRLLVAAEETQMNAETAQPAAADASAQSEPTATPHPTPTPTPTPTPSPTPSPTPTPTPKTLSLRANSVDRDIYITVCGSDGRPVYGTVFTLDVTFPGGATYSYSSETDGSCYLVRLEAGDYRIAMREAEGFLRPEPISCTVASWAQYTQIEDIQTVADVKDVTEIAQSEKPTETQQAPEAVVAEEITTPEEALDDGIIVIGEEPVLDEQGNAEMRYTVNLGPNGYLLYRETGEESAVLPIDEDGDGLPEYGLEFVPEILDEEGNVLSESYTLSVELYDENGDPLDLYDISIAPVMTEVTKQVGWQEIDGKTYYLNEDGSRAVGLKKIDGKLYYFNCNGEKASAVGVDVSYYNNSIDWQMVKAQGIDFAIIRVGGRGWTSGALYGDSRTQEYLYGAKAAGIKVGVYFYSTAINSYEAVEEASVALATIGGVSLDYPVFIDMEYSGEYPNGRADQLTPAQRASVATAFCETVRNAGYRPGVYAGQNYLKYAMDYGSVSGYTIWLASYTLDNQFPDFPYRYDIWQFTDRAAIDGIEGSADVNVIF